jgi:ATP-dependent Clp protease protease subunit
MRMTATFLLYGDIVPFEEKQTNELFGVNIGVSSKDISDFIEANKEAEEYIIRINSRGGSVTEGFLIHDLLVNSGKKVTTIGEGKIFSIATVVFLAGNKRVMLENSDGLIHMPFIPPYTLADSYDSKELGALTESLKQEEEKILQFYVQKTGHDKEELRAFMEKETMLAAADMLKLGFATEIKEQLKAVAFINNSLTNKKTNEMAEKTVMEKILDRADAILAKFSRIDAKNMEQTDVNGNKFTVEREEGDIQVGDKANPDGEYTLENGTKVVVLEGVITEMVPAAEEGDGEMEALKAENAELKEKLAAMEAKVSNVANLETEMKGLITDLRAQKSVVTIEGRQQNFKKVEQVKNQVDKDDIRERMKKLNNK